MAQHVSESALSPFVFGGLPDELTAFDSAQALIWPVPFERTVSYGSGTEGGPEAIINASRNMELYDEEVHGEPALIGIHTLPAFQSARDLDGAIEDMEQETERHLGSGKFLCALGGEHSITGPIVRAYGRRFPNLSVLQIDAHADLREQYDGTRHSHASAMRRVTEVCPVVQVGIRSLSADEARAIPSLPTRIYYAKDIAGRRDWIEEAVGHLTENVYLTIDIDGLDPSLVPTTGTPEPGGLGWYEVLELIRTLAARRRIVGMDLVELSADEHFPAPAFLAAKLVYKSIAYRFRSQIPTLE